ncbi:hypothetical protein CAEBREN_25850 [Caenorhabditis brenneri]|uniref:SET domain-containing protein n=1 Tax=Caenorhabditis brenneri TaxID=135651 RepID=G0M867_CAEBE|nr:hypothetical protein CAEBREN_25850 [Caenorhabditis brenneri]
MAPRTKITAKPPIPNEGRRFKLQCPTVKEVRDFSWKQEKAFGKKENNVALLKTDDFVRSALIDNIVGFSCNKCYKNYKKVPQHIGDIIKGLLFTNVIGGNDLEIGKTIVFILKQFWEDENLAMIVSNYLKLFNINTGVTIGICTMYTDDNNLGLKLICTRNWKPNEFLDLHNLSSPFNEAPQETNTYSTSSILPKRDKDGFWLGPLAIINHSCDPNAIFVNYGRKTLVKILKPIKVGEEVFVNYGPKYFGLGHCQCEPCQKKSIVVEQKHQENSGTRYVFRERPKILTPEEVLPIYVKLFHHTVMTPELKSEWGPILDMIGIKVFSSLVPAFINYYIQMMDEETSSDTFSAIQNKTQNVGQVFENRDHASMGLSVSKVQLSQDLINIATKANNINLSLLDNSDPQPTPEKLRELESFIKNAAISYKNHEDESKRIKEASVKREQERQAELQKLKESNNEDMLPKPPGMEREGLAELSPAHQRLVCKLFKWPTNDLAELDAIEDLYNGNGSAEYAVPDHSPLLQNSSTTSTTSSVERETTPLPRRSRKRTYKPRKDGQSGQVGRKRKGKKRRTSNLKSTLDSNMPSTSGAYDYNYDEPVPTITPTIRCMHLASCLKASNIFSLSVIKGAGTRKV